MKGKICRFITGLVIATTLLTSCSAVGGVLGEADDIGGYTQSVSKKEAVKLSKKDMARFEAVKGVPIDVVVDENSQWGMIEKVQQAIKNTIEQYNEMFSYINPDYQLRYISRDEYEKRITDNPFILVTTELRIQTQAGSARAVTSPPKPTESRYGNGSTYSNSIVVISSTGTVNLTEEEIQNVIAHEFGHVFGILEHSEDASSMMADTSSGVTISSKEFSLDMLTSFKDMYYNSKTNTIPESEIDSYISSVSSLRKQQLSEFNKAEGSAQEVYKEKLKGYAKEKGLTLISAEEMVGMEYSTTSIYGQTRTITFNEDGTYLLQVYDEDRSIECKGIYIVKDNLIICSGENFAVDKNFNYVKIQDKLFFSATESGCVYGTESGKGTITGEMADTSLIEDFGV